MSTASKSLIVTAGLFLCGCRFGDMAEGIFPIGNEGQMIAASADSIRDFVVTGGTQEWVREPMPHPSSGHRRAQTAFNNLYLTALRTNSFPMPVGAAAAKEVFQDDGTHFAWTLSLKTKAGSGGDTWTWWEGEAPEYQAVAFGIGVFACERCHGGAEDRDRSLSYPPL